VINQPVSGFGISKLEIAVEDQIRRRLAADRNEIDRQVIDLDDSRCSQEPERENGQSGLGSDRQPPRNVGPVRPDGLPGAENPSTLSRSPQTIFS
jgi:hypothetical protein